MLIVNPAGSAARTAAKVAPRPMDLAGLRLGLLDNGKVNFDYLLDDFEGFLREKYPTATVVRRRKPSVSSPCPGDTKKELLEKCDIIITGLGD